MHRLRSLKENDHPNSMQHNSKLDEGSVGVGAVPSLDLDGSVISGAANLNYNVLEEMKAEKSRKDLLDEYGVVGFQSQVHDGSGSGLGGGLNGSVVQNLWQQAGAYNHPLNLELADKKQEVYYLPLQVSN